MHKLKNTYYLKRNFDYLSSVVSKILDLLAYGFGGKLGMVFLFFISTNCFILCKSFLVSIRFYVTSIY
jgi:hypothetical protein